MKAHFYQAINETGHLEEMESRSGNRYWVDRFFARHLVLFNYWVMVFYYLLSPSNVYDINIKIEEHAYETYAKYLVVNPSDQGIREIAQNDINHANELKGAIALISLDANFLLVFLVTIFLCGFKLSKASISNNSELLDTSKVLSL